MKGIKVLKDMILFKALEAETKETISAGGLIIPVSANKNQEARRFRTGEVITVGLDCQNVIAGDTIYYGKGADVEIFLEDTAYLMINEEAVFAVKSK